MLKNILVTLGLSLALVACGDTVTTKKKDMTAPPDLVEVPDLVEIPTCPNERDLSKVDLPCDCYGTIVPEPPSEAMPECEKVIKCCPAERGLKCE